MKRYIYNLFLPLTKLGYDIQKVPKTYEKYL